MRSWSWPADSSEPNSDGRRSRTADFQWASSCGLTLCRRQSSAWLAAPLSRSRTTRALNSAENDRRGRGIRLTPGKDQYGTGYWSSARGAVHISLIRAVTFSRDGKTLASAGDDHLIKLWNVATGQNADLRGHTTDVRCIAFSPDGKTLAS